MIDFTTTIVIDRAVEDVYDYLSDLERVPEWNWAIARTEKITPGEIEVGTRYQQTRIVPQPATETLEITGLDPYRFIEIKGSLAGLPTRLRYALEENGRETAVTNTVQLAVKGALQLAAPILERRVSRAVASNLNDLKIQLESGRRPQDWNENQTGELGVT